MKDEDIFQDTFLTLTRTYQPDQDFVSEFKRKFIQIKLEYYEKGKQQNYLIHAIYKEEQINSEG